MLSDQIALSSVTIMYTSYLSIVPKAVELDVEVEECEGIWR